MAKQDKLLALDLVFSKTAMNRFSVFLILLVYSHIGLSQSTLQFIQSSYFDSFTEWILYFDDNQEGIIEVKWPNSNDWTQWSIDVGDYYGTQRQLSQQNPNHWQAKILGKIIDFRTTYPGDFTKWNVRYESDQYRLFMPYTNQVEDWTLEKGDSYFDVFTTIKGDPRDWSFEESEDNSIPMELKLSSVALIISISTPNY